MGIKVKGIGQAKKNLTDIINDVRGRRVVRGIQSGLILIGSRAAYYTPIDTSTLINSQFREIDAGGVIITGRIGYSANYAVYVHEASGKLKDNLALTLALHALASSLAAVQKGNYWDPHGEPQFLNKGANDERDNVDAVMRKELSL